MVIIRDLFVNPGTRFHGNPRSHGRTGYANDAVSLHNRTGQLRLGATDHTCHKDEKIFGIGSVYGQLLQTVDGFQRRGTTHVRRIVYALSSMTTSKSRNLHRIKANIGRHRSASQ